MVTPTGLVLEPSTQALANIILRYKEGKPLSPEELRFLHRYHNKISTAGFDPILDYFKVSYKHQPRKADPSFLNNHSHFNHDSLLQFKTRLASTFEKTSPAVIPIVFSMKQYEEFKLLTTNETTFWHGNQYLTKAPFFAGGIPHVDLFEWDNFFGIAKYVMIAGEVNNSATQVLLHFQEKQGHTLTEFVADYLHSKVMEPTPEPTDAPQPNLADDTDGLVIDSFQLSLHPHP